MPHLVAILIYLSQNHSYYIRGDRSPLNCSLIQIVSKNNPADTTKQTPRIDPMLVLRWASVADGGPT